MQPLAGLKVIDLGRYLTGPYCAMKLGDMGADVIKVETPGKGDESRKLGPPFLRGEASYFLMLNRNKRSITINLRKPKGIEVLKKLIKEADVIIENFRPGIMEKIGLPYGVVKDLNERIIYCSITGYGQESPNKDRPSFDVMIQAESGLMDLTGFVDGPPTRVGVPIADILAALHGVEGILLALLARNRTGKGQHIDISMMDTVISILTNQAGIYLATGKSPKRIGNKHPMITPYESFESKDGYIIIAAANQKLWENLCRAIKKSELIKDPRFLTMSDRNINNFILKEEIDKITRKKTTDEWKVIFEEADVPCGRIRNLEEVFTDEHVKVRNMVVEKEHLTAGKIKLLGIPIKLSETPGRINTPPPLLGEHTEQILTELKYSLKEINWLKQNNVI